MHGGRTPSDRAPRAERSRPDRPVAAGACRLAALAVVAFALLAAQAARAVPPKYFEIGDARVVIESGMVVAKLSVGVDNATGLFEMLKDGASVELEINARLERVRTFWTNVTLAEADFFSSLQHNPLTREFSLYMPGQTTPLLDRNLERLLAATWEKFEAPVADVSELDGEGDSPYRLTLTLNLQHAKPPPWLAKNFMFWSKAIVEAETVELPFRY